MLRLGVGGAMRQLARLSSESEVVVESSELCPNLQWAPLVQVGRLSVVRGDRVGVSRELGVSREFGVSRELLVEEHLVTCSSSLAMRSRAKVRRLADCLAPSSSLAIRCRAPVRSGVRVGEVELEGGPVSDRSDLVRMVGEVELQVGLLDRFLARSMRASVLELMVELDAQSFKLNLCLGS